MHFALFIYLFLEIEFSSFSRYFCSLLFLFSAANKAHIAFASMYVCVCLRTAQCKRKVNVSVDVAVNVSRRSAALLLFVLSCCFLAAVVFVFVRLCVCVCVFFIASVLLIRLPSCTQRVCLCVCVCECLSIGAALLLPVSVCWYDFISFVVGHRQCGKIRFDSMKFVRFAANLRIFEMHFKYYNLLLLLDIFKLILFNFWCFHLSFLNLFFYRFLAF